MKTNKIPFINTQIKIVTNLLDGSKKYQRKIASEIGRGESTTSRALDYLVREKVVEKDKKEVTGGKRNKGKYPAKLCYLSYEIDNGAHILNFFKTVLLQKNLKKSDEKDIINNLHKIKKIRELLLKKHFILLKYSIDCFPSLIESNSNVMLTQTKYFHDHLINECIPHVHKELLDCLQSSDFTSFFKAALNYYLRCSPTFFKNLLKHTPEELQETYGDAYSNPNNALFIKCFNLSIHDTIFNDLKEGYYNNYLLLLINTLFSESIHIDALEGNTLQDSLFYKNEIIDKNGPALISNLINRVDEISRYDNQMFYTPDYYKIFK